MFENIITQTQNDTDIKSDMSFDEIFKTYNAILLKHAKYKISDSDVSEDLVQETYLKVWKYMVNGGEIKTMKTFLYQVLNNLIIDQYRKRKDYSLDFLLEDSHFEPGIDEREKVMNQIDGRNMFKLIEEMDNPHKEILKMRYIDDMTLEEIALVTDKTKNNISVSLHRAIEKLKIMSTPV